MSGTSTSLTRKEFLTLTVGGKEALRGALKGQPWSAAMDLRHKMQMGLASYAKGKGSAVDEVQRVALESIQAIEKWCRQAYFRRRVFEIQKQDPGLLRRGKDAKWLVKREWEALVKKWSF